MPAAVVEFVIGNSGHRSFRSAKVWDACLVGNNFIPADLYREGSSHTDSKVFCSFKPRL